MTVAAAFDYVPVLSDLPDDLVEVFLESVAHGGLSEFGIEFRCFEEQDAASLGDYGVEIVESDRATI